MVYIPLIYFILLALHYYRKQHRWSAEIAAISILILICLAAVVIDIRDFYGQFGCNENNLNIIGVSLFCLEWTILFQAIRAIANKPIIAPNNIVQNKEKIFILFMFICVVIRIIFLGTDIIQALREDPLSVKEHHYEELENGTTTLGRNIFMYLPLLFVSTPYSTIALVWFFYGLATRTYSIKQNLMLLFISFAPIAIATLIAGRSAIVYWGVEFYILMCLFWKDLSPKLHRLIIRTSIILGSIIISVFLIVTIARFNRSSPIDSIIGYMGQPLNNFCTFLAHGQNAPFQIGRVFPLIYKLQGHNFTLMQHYQHIASSCGIKANVFSTFGGVVYVDLGIGAFVFLLLLMMYIVHSPLQRMQMLSLPNTIWLAIILAFFSHGLFGWPFVGHYATGALFSLLCVYVWLNYKFKYKNSSCSSTLS